MKNQISKNYDNVTEREVQLMILAGLTTEVPEDDNGNWLDIIEADFNIKNQEQIELLQIII